MRFDIDIINNENNEFVIELLFNRVKIKRNRKTIGRGTFGKVKKGLHRITQEPVAIKILEKSKIKDVTDVERVSR
jgi:hypothetical protein